jgi:hypothetical protein
MRRLLGLLLSPRLLGAEGHETAWQRADSLLRDSLLPSQYECYRSRGYVELPSRLYPGRIYRVDGWRPVGVYENGQFAGAVCIRPQEALPGPDVLLARKLMIEGAEEQFLSSGNWLQPAWRPAGAVPTIFLIVALLSPWLIHLRALGLWGLGFALSLLVIPLMVTGWRRRMRRRPIELGPTPR